MRDTPVTGWDVWDKPARAAADDDGAIETTEVRTVTRAAPPAAPSPEPTAAPNPAPPMPGDRVAPTVTGVHEIPSSRRVWAPHGASPATAAPSIPPGADLPTLLARLRRSTDRDEVISLAVAAVATTCRRAALFVVKKSVAQGWDARGEGVAAGAIRNVWIPVSSPSVLRQAATSLEPFVGPVEDTIANGILMAALGRRADRVGVWPVVVRDRAVAILYADGFDPAGLGRVDEIVHELAQAFERIILGDKSHR